MVARRQMKTTFSRNGIPQSRVIEHQLRDNPIYGRTTPHEPGHLDNCNSLHPHQHQHHHQQHCHHHLSSSSAAAAAHNYEKLDHVVVNPAPVGSSSANPIHNLLTVATPTSAVASPPPDLVNTMGYLVAGPTSRDQLARPIIIWAPRSRDESDTAQLNVVTDQHGRQCCCCTSASGHPSTATSGGGYMECDARARTHAIGGEESRDRHHVTGTADCRDAGGRHDTWFPRDQNTSHRCSRVGRQYTAMSHNTHNRLNDWNISAL